MAYSSYKNLKKVIDKFVIKVEPNALFSSDTIKPIEPSHWLKTSMEMSEMLGFCSEKERSERLTNPILTELVKINNDQITLYSGRKLNMNKDLEGTCDYLITLGHKVIDYFIAPLFCIVQAPKQDISHGIAQCAVQLMGVKIYNENDGIQLPYLYGAATDGQKWRFLRLKDNVITIHDSYYSLGNLPMILGVLNYLIDDCKTFKI